MATVKAYDEGNSVNAAAFLVLIIAGLYILSKRNIDWGRFLSKNKILWLYLSFCLVSVLWADLPFTSLKRWLKEFGNLVMVLIVLTDEHPYEAIGAVLRRLGYVWLPLSVIFIKYYPALGRSYTEQGGQMYMGIGMQKNELGSICLISLIYYAWYFLLRRKTASRFWSINNLVDLVLILMALWLLHLSKSSTCLGCAIIATAMLATSRFTPNHPDRIFTWSIAAVLLYLGLNEVLDLNAIIIHMLGRKENLTGRTQIWSLLKEMAVHRWIGAGYQSFWVGDRLREIWERAGSDIIQAHDGYLEQYLELGYIGVGFIVALILCGLAKIRRLCRRDYAAGVLMLCFLVVATLYNYTEASFYAISNIWILMVLAVSEAPGRILEEAITQPAGCSKGTFSRLGR
ncbi:MAG: O-antigen ligase family protein [Syntrophobacteraceae bacterium]